MPKKKKLSHEVIAELRAKLKWLRSRMNYERKRSYMYGYNKCVKELGKPIKPPKVKVVKEVRKVTKEVTVPIQRGRGEFADMVSDTIVVSRFCAESGIHITIFPILLAILTVENPTLPKLKQFGWDYSVLRYRMQYLEQEGWVEVFRNSTKAMTIVPSLKGQKLFSSFKEYYGENTGTKRRRSIDS